MILYPTETIYGLGVNALDEAAVLAMEEFKGGQWGGREGKSVSWLVRDIKDILQYGELTPQAAKIAERFLPGQLTLVLWARDAVPRPLRGPHDSVSFRISPDPIAQQLIADFMEEHNAPLTATSANVTGQPTLSTPSEILSQFEKHGRDISTVNRIIDDGPRAGVASTVVRVFGDQVEILREGAIPALNIFQAVDQDVL